MPYALDYGRIIILGFTFYSIDVAFGSLFRANGRPNVNMIGLIIGCVTNCILDPIFIFVFDHGGKGAEHGAESIQERMTFVVSNKEI